MLTLFFNHVFICILTNWSPDAFNIVADLFNNHSWVCVIEAVNEQ